MIAHMMSCDDPHDFMYSSHVTAHMMSHDSPHEFSASGLLPLHYIAEYLHANISNLVGLFTENYVSHLFLGAAV